MRYVLYIHLIHPDLFIHFPDRMTFSYIGYGSIWILKNKTRNSKMWSFGIVYTLAHSMACYSATGVSESSLIRVDISPGLSACTSYLIFGSKSIYMYSQVRTVSQQMTESRADILQSWHYIFSGWHSISQKWSIPLRLPPDNQTWQRKIAEIYSKVR